MSSVVVAKALVGISSVAVTSAALVGVSYKFGLGPFKTNDSETVFVLAKSTAVSDQATGELNDYKCQITGNQESIDSSCYISEIDISVFSGTNKHVDKKSLQEYKGSEAELANLKVADKYFKLTVSKNLFDQLSFSSTAQTMDILPNVTQDNKKFAQLTPLIAFYKNEAKTKTQYAVGKVSDLLNPTNNQSTSEQQLTTLTNSTFSCSFTSNASKKETCTIHSLVAAGVTSSVNLPDLTFSDNSSNNVTQINKNHHYLFKLSSEKEFSYFNSKGTVFVVATNNSSEEKKLAVVDLIPSYIIGDSSNKLLFKI